MKTMAIHLAIPAALTIAAVATISSSSVSRALAGPEDLSRTPMPIDQITATAKDLPVRSFDAF